ncbi:MAG: chromate transporter, partial [Byssovorax sp.]
MSSLAASASASSTCAAGASTTRADEAIGVTEGDPTGATPEVSPPALQSRLKELAALFLRLGVTAFGGPAVHVARMEDEVVRRRAWLTREEFLDLYGATNLIPGPNSTEMAIHIGHRRAGCAGLLVAGTCFIVPAALITLWFAWAYIRFGSLPAAGWLLYGVKPVIVAVVLQALWGLGKTAVKTKLLAAVGVAGVLATALGANELVVLFGAGALVAATHRLAQPRTPEEPKGPSAAAVVPFALVAG